jgi:TolA-binding protein
MKRISLVFCLILAVMAFSAPVRAQQPTQPTQPTTTAASPILTEVEQLKMENINLRFTALQNQIQQVQQQAQQLIVSIETAHPGYSLNFQTGQLTPKPVESPKDTPAPEKK